MMANNSAGARSVLYGKTIDHVLEQVVALSDGSVAHFRDVPRDAGPNGRHARSRLLPHGAAAGVASTPPRSTAAIPRCCAASAATIWTNLRIPRSP